MRCDEVLDLMNCELDGDLTDEEQKTLHDHLHSCSNCTEMYTRLRAVSSQLQALPMVIPPLSIVDSILPALEELDKRDVESNPNEQDFSDGPIPLEQGEQGSGIKKPWAKKRWWIPGAVVAAGLLAVYISSTTPFGSSSNESATESGASTEEAMHSNEVVLDTAEDMDMNKRKAFTDEESSQGGDLSLENDNSQEDQQMSTFQLSEQEFAAGVDTEQPALHSPNGEYVVQPGYENEDIRIDLQNGDPYYITKTTWKKPWEIHSMEWVSNEQFYFVLYNSESEEYQYWLINARERTEEQLEGEYQQ